MNRRQADLVAGTVLAGVLLVGVVSTVELALSDDVPMGDAGGAPVMRAFGPVLMSLVLATLLGGVYVYVRGRLFTTGPDAADLARDDAGPAAGTAGTDPDDSTPRRDLLDVLPEDEHRVLEPVVESPGLTQIEVRDRSGFSKSKVSQTITDLEERGLLYRERQGRTYRVYPADDLEDRS